MFHSAVRTLKAHRIRPDARQCRLIDVQLKINSLPGLMAPTNAEFAFMAAVAVITLILTWRYVW
jgi:hypothetical protein